MHRYLICRNPEHNSPISQQFCSSAAPLVKVSLFLYTEPRTDLSHLDPLWTSREGTGWPEPWKMFPEDTG